MVSGARKLENTSAARPLRAELLGMAEESENTGAPLVLRMIHPRLSEARIAAEWSAALRVLRPEVSALLGLEVVLRSGKQRTFGTAPSTWTARPALRSTAPEPSHALGRADMAFAVEKVLIWAWLLRRGPLTRVWIQETVGCSYPTVAGVIGALGGAIARQPDRRVELRYLPPAEWRRFVAVAPTGRCTLSLSDRSGRGNAADLLERLQALAPAGVAVGGVAAARHLYPELDLAGLPRLDLSVHAPNSSLALGFLRKLDPALKPAAPDEPATVVLHFVRHRETLFDLNDDGVPWADPVEVLLDLDEAGLTAQAAELLDALTARVAP